METTQIQSKEIQWRQVGSLIALDIAILLSWIAYHEYQPKLLIQFKYTDYAIQLALIQGIILILTPPIAGYFADMIRSRKGDRLPVINVGINVVSMVFMTVAVTVFANPTGIVRMLFPLMIVLWLISMNIFHSPAISTVELFVPASKLPQVMAIFAVIADLTQSIEPSIIDIINILGPATTFALGGAFVFITGYMLQKATKDLTVSSPNSEESIIQLSPKSSNYLIVILLGLGAGIATSVFFKIFPSMATLQINTLLSYGLKQSTFVSILIAIAAILAIPISRIVERIGVQTSMIFGLIACIVLAFGIYELGGSTTALFLYFLYPVSFSFVAVSSLPIAFMKLSSRNKVLGIGLYFSGIELMDSLVDILQTAGLI